MRKITLLLSIIAILTAFSSFAATYSGLGEKSVSPENIKKFAPTPIERGLARKIQSFMDVRSPGMGEITNDGRRLFFSWRVTGTTQVWRLDGPMSFPVQMTGGEDSTTISAVTPDGKHLVLSRDRKGEENPGLYLQDSNGGSLTVIQHKEGAQTFFQYLSPDSKHLYYKSNDIKADSYAIYRFDLESGKRELIFSEPGLWGIDDWKKDGTILLQKMTGNRSTEYSTWNPTEKKLTPLVGQGETVDYVVAFGVRDGEYFVLTDKFGEFHRLYLLKNGQYKPVTPDIKHDVSGFRIDEQRKRVLYEVNEGGYVKLFALDAKTLKPISLPRFPKADQIYSGITTRNSRFTTIGIETAKAPRTSYVYDWNTGKLTQWLKPNAPEVDLSVFTEAKLEYYPARDGTKIPMFVRRPPICEKQTCPVVVEFHGGPEGQSTPGFNVFAELFLQAGFIFVEPNVRGSEGYGKTWLDSDNGPKRLNVVTDIEDCATFIRANWSKDGKTPKIGVIGGSYGGYSTLMAMTRFAGAYDAGVAIVGISNLVTFLNNTAPYRRSLRVTEYGDPEKDKEALIELSPTTHLSKLKAPLLIIQGLSDPRVPAGEAIQFYEELEKKKIASGLVLFPDEGHGAQKRENKVLEWGHSLQFLFKHLKEN